MKPHLKEKDSPKTRVRSIFISDVHLGSHGCKAKNLLNFMRQYESEYLYLVGDIVDGWLLSRRWYWPQEHSDVIQKLLRKARKGTKVVFVPGNHDEFARQYCDMKVGGINVQLDHWHITADGRKLWITHGDQFDSAIRFGKWLAKLGGSAYEYLIVLNNVINYTREKLGLPYWSLAAYVKRNVKNAVKYISKFEEVVSEETAAKGYDGVVCGHIHQPCIKQINAVTYHNCGDWVETCSALIEHESGELELVYFGK